MEEGLLLFKRLVSRLTQDKKEKYIRMGCVIYQRCHVANKVNFGEGGTATFYESDVRVENVRLRVHRRVILFLFMWD